MSTVNATGGIIAFSDGTFGCTADEEWLDLAEAAIAAHEALKAAGLESELTITDAEPYEPTNYFGGNGKVVKRL